MVEVNRIVSSVGNEHAAKVGYEPRFLSRNRHMRRAAFLDALVVECGDCRYLSWEIGLN